MLSWTAKRQLFFFGIFALAVFLMVGGIIYFFRPAPSCFDQKQNQREEGVDCGGPCELCIGNPQDLIVFWARAFELVPGHWEVGALVENPNLLVGAKELTYKVRLYDASNVLVALKEGRTFLNPREKFLIFEEDISTGERVPTRATIEFSEIPWRRIERERPSILVSSKNFENAPNGVARVVLKNQSLFGVEDIFVGAALLDSSGNAIGVSSSKIERIDGEAFKEAVFTWRAPFDPPPTNVEVLVRTNLTE